MNNNTIAVEKLIRKPEFQKRFSKELDPNHVQSLLDDIKEGKDLTPVWVWDAGLKGLHLIAGFHRAEAYRLAKKPVPYTIVTTDEREAHQLAHKENSKRKDLTNFERINSFLDLKNRQHSPDEIKQSLGLDPQKLSELEAVVLYPQLV